MVGGNEVSVGNKNSSASVMRVSLEGDGGTRSDTSTAPSTQVLEVEENENVVT